MPGLRPTLFTDLTRGGRLRVIGRQRTVQPYGVCGRDLSAWERCTEVMLLPDDARFVLRAAVAHERRGGNHMSEYDG